MKIDSITLGENLALLLRDSHQTIEQRAREMIVLELYRRSAISSGKAAELLNMSRFDFIRYASRLGIPFFDMTEAEWQAEQELAQTL